MFLWKKRRALSVMLIICLIFTSEFNVLSASASNTACIAPTIEYKTYTSPLAEIWNQIPELADVAMKTQEWYGKALINTDDKVYVYSEPSENGTIIGHAFKNTVVDVEEVDSIWTKVTSNSIIGYMKSDILLTGIDAVNRAEITCVNGTTGIRSVEDIEIEKMLAALIYCEAGNQPYEGKVGVGAVVMNRVKSGRFPNTIREVVYQRGQFTPALNGKLERVIVSNNIPESCYEAARAALNGENTVGDALFFNGKSGNFKIGDHYFR